MTKPKNEGSCPNCVPYFGEIDWVNQHVAAALGVPLKFLYPSSDGLHPNTRALRMDLEEYTKIQRENDTRDAVKTVPCETCKQGVEYPANPVPIKSISQQMAMSEAWSRDLRAKVQESERQREAKKSKICVDIDDYDY